MGRNFYYDALDGKETSAIFRDCKIDLCIIDLLMPEQDGIETLKDVRSVSPAAKVIGFSAAGEFLSLMEDFGADMTLQKPLNRQKILKAVQKCLAT